MIGWNDVAKTWNSEIGIDGNWFHKSVIYPSITSIITDISTSSILDIGCGNGHLCRFLKKTGVEYIVGIDSSENMISECINQSDNVEYRQMSAENLLFQSDDFDYCIFNNSLQDIEPYNIAIREAHRVLRSKGKIVAVTRHPCFHPTDDNLGWYLRSDNTEYMNGKGLTNLLYESNEYSGLYFAMDDYFGNPKHMRSWYGKVTHSFRRTIQDYCNAIIKAGFSISSIIEPLPSDEHKGDYPCLHELLTRIPNFIIFVGEKRSAI